MKMQTIVEPKESTMGGWQSVQASEQSTQTNQTNNQTIESIQNKKHFMIAMLVITLVVWGSSYSFIRTAVQGYTPEHVAIFRYLLGSLFFLALAPLFKVRLPKREDVGLIAALGLLGVSVYNVCLCRAELSVPAGIASLIVATSPIFTALIASFFLKEKLTKVNWLGFGLSFVGVAVISLTGVGGLKFDIGILLVLIAALVQGITIVLQKKVMSKYTPMESMVYTIASGTLFLLPFASGLLEEVKVAPLASTISVVYLALVSGGLGFITWSFALSRTDASKMASLLYFIPFLAVMIAWFWLGEQPGVSALIGGLIIMAGVKLSNGRKPATANSTIPKTDTVDKHVHSEIGNICTSLKECVEAVGACRCLQPVAICESNQQ